ncbi:MAG: hypothetical protein K2O70_09960 [Desulfovibrionaceae bacterium]|nr:hypothetical protein [Desulfovibrionaceae bacterium]
MRGKILFLSLLALALCGPVVVSAEPSRHAANTAAWKPHGSVEGFEYKFPLKTELFKTRAPLASFRHIVESLRATAEREGYTVEPGPMKLRLRTKTYFDTPDSALRKAGFIIRVVTTYKDGRPGDKVRFTVKTSGKGPEFVLGTPLRAAIRGGGISAEDNPYIGDDGVIRSKVEKSVDLRKLPVEELGNLQRPTLAQFIRLVPDLAHSGLSPDTVLTPLTAYSYSVKAGFVELAGRRAEIGLEAWTGGCDGVPLVLELSYGVEDADYYTMPEVVAAGDAFLHKVLAQGMKNDAASSTGRFHGSKLEVLRNASGR